MSVQSDSEPFRSLLRQVCFQAQAVQVVGTYDTFLLRETERYVILALIGTAAGRQTVIVLEARTEDIVVPVGIRAVRVVYGLSLHTPVLVFLVSDRDEILRS